MFDRFSEHARRTMMLARQEALRLHHDYIGTEHILLGLVEESGGTGAQVLRDLGVELSDVRDAVTKLIQPGTSEITYGQLPFTPRGKHVLELSLEEAQSAGHRHIGTEHLLLGLVRESGGIAGKALLGLGLTVEQVRAKVFERVPAQANTERPTPRPGSGPGDGT